ncbi:MAG: MoaD/ThiS family protein [Deltaproteobacteria bacterium]|nr:MoaD/ThiS family protein [Deltaproteobacteria bacterium]
MVIHLKLFSPLSDAAGAAELCLSVEEKANLRNLVEALVARFGGEMKKHLFDVEGRIIPSWAVFINKRVVPLNQPDALEAQVEAGDEVSFILNIAGG